jgi:hypothetical protein
MKRKNKKNNLFKLKKIFLFLIKHGKEKNWKKKEKYKKN